MDPETELPLIVCRRLSYSLLFHYNSAVCLWTRTGVLRQVLPSPALLTTLYIAFKGTMILMIICDDAKDDLSNMNPPFV